MDQKRLFHLAFIVLGLITLTPARSAEAPIIDVDVLKRGMLDIKVVEDVACDQPGFDFTPLSGVLVPPLIQAGIAQAGGLLVKASGKNDTTLSLYGQTTEASFYCVDRKVADKPGPAGEKVAEDSFYLLPKSIIVSTPNQHKNAKGEFFKASFDLKLSPDRTAFRLVPSQIDYPTYIMNPRAFGAVISLKINAGSESISTGVLPLGMMSCGRVGSSCSKEKSAGILTKVGSPWQALPAAKATPPVIGDFTKKNEITETRFRSLPITVSATITEVSTYNKLIAFLGGFMGDNKSDIKEGIVGVIPALTPADSIERYNAESKIAISRAEYKAYSQKYNNLLANQADCDSQLQAWKSAVQAAANANILTSLMDSPPPCIRR